MAQVLVSNVGDPRVARGEADLLRVACERRLTVADGDAERATKPATRLPRLARAGQPLTTNSSLLQHVGLGRRLLCNAPNGVTEEWVTSSATSVRSVQRFSLQTRSGTATADAVMSTGCRRVPSGACRDFD